MPGICHSPRWAPCLLRTPAMLPPKYLPDIHLKRLLKSLFPFPPNNSYLLLLVMVLNHNPMKPRVLVWKLRRHILGEPAVIRMSLIFSAFHVGAGCSCTHCDVRVGCLYLVVCLPFSLF